VIYRLPPLNALRVFEAAARHLSFKEAAQELHITQAAVSHQVKSLEEYLGVQLFRRSARGVQLTEAGRACLPKLREGFDALAAAVEMIRERGEEAELVITAPPVFTARWLMPRLADFSKSAPKIELRVFASSKMVDAGALDSTALVGHLDLRTESSEVQIHLGAGHYPGHRADRLFGVAMAAVASRELVRGDPPLKRPEDLAHHTLLHDDAMELLLEHPLARGRLATARGGARAAPARRCRYRLGAPLRALRHRGQAAVGLLPRLPGGDRRSAGSRRVQEVASVPDAQGIEGIIGLSSFPSCFSKKNQPYGPCAALGARKVFCHG
jgi:DNA-binding transcriptional LysR family regulator